MLPSLSGLPLRSEGLATEEAITLCKRGTRQLIGVNLKAVNPGQPHFSQHNLKQPNVGQPNVEQPNLGQSY